jgi:hypothetical protein
MRLGIQTAGFAHAVVVDDGSQIHVGRLGRAIAETCRVWSRTAAQAGGSFEE